MKSNILLNSKKKKISKTHDCHRCLLSRKMCLEPKKVFLSDSRLPVGEEVRALTPLREFEILLIICAIVFLALLLVTGFEPSNPLLSIEHQSFTDHPLVPELSGSLPQGLEWIKCDKE